MGSGQVEGSEGKPGWLWIDTSAAFAELLARLHDAPVVAVDTESNSLYAYQERVCLIQFSLPGVDYLVDSLAVDVTPLGEWLADPAHEKVFHAADYDILCLKRQYGFTFEHLFDTMIAARVLGWPELGLAAILQERFGVRLSKRLQRCDWGARPLPPEALEYARLDTHFLLDLRQYQLQELRAHGRWEEACHAFRRQTQVRPAPKSFDPQGFWRIRGARDLLPVEQAVLRELYLYRDRCARERNRPPFKILDDATLVQLARQRPANRQALLQLKGVSRRMSPDEADRLLAAIARGLAATPPVCPCRAPTFPADQVMVRYQALRSWRNQKALARGVEPGVILSNQALMALAQAAPRTAQQLKETGLLDEWQCPMYGEDVLQVLQRLEADG